MEFRFNAEASRIEVLPGGTYQRNVYPFSWKKDENKKWMLVLPLSSSEKILDAGHETFIGYFIDGCNINLDSFEPYINPDEFWKIDEKADYSVLFKKENYINIDIKESETPVYTETPDYIWNQLGKAKSKSYAINLGNWVAHTFVEKRAMEDIKSCPISEIAKIMYSDIDSYGRNYRYNPTGEWKPYCYQQDDLVAMAGSKERLLQDYEKFIELKLPKAIEKHGNTYETRFKIAIENGAHFTSIYPSVNQYNEYKAEQQKKMAEAKTQPFFSVEEIDDCPFLQ